MSLLVKLQRCIHLLPSEELLFMGSNLALGSKPQNLMHNLRVDRVKSLLSLAAQHTT